MGTTCILGVDDNKILKDFVRAHVELLKGPKICLSHWYPDLRHGDKTIRYFYSSNPGIRRVEKLLPHAVYDRVANNPRRTKQALHDSFTTFFKGHDVDVILAEFGPDGADITPHARELGIPLIVHFHGHDAHRRATVEAYASRYKPMFGYASAIISVSRYMTDALVKLGADPSKVVYNPYGPRDAFFDVKPDYDSKTILSVGRFTDIKANHLTLLAFSKAAASVPDARLVMIGEGELLEACKTLSKALDVQDRVTFTGAVPHAQVTSWYGNACCFAQHSVSPSYGDAEGTPVAVIEAGAAALPVIATKHAGIPDVVIDTETGYLVNEGDIDTMAEKMKAMLVDADSCRRMGEAARNRVRSSFSMSRHIGELQRVIDDARARAANR